MTRWLVRHVGSAVAHATLLLALTAGREPDGDDLVVELVPDSSAVSADDTPLAGVPESSPAGDVEVPPSTIDGFTIDLDKIKAQRSTLFPFLTLDLMFLAPLQSDVAAARSRLPNPFASGAGAADLPPLELTDAALRDIVDRAWSRRRRWDTFAPLAAALTSHAANSGRSADLVRAYLDDNILQPYCDGARRDPRFWAMLENAADHAWFIDFVRSFARARTRPVWRQRSSCSCSTSSRRGAATSCSC